MASTPLTPTAEATAGSPVASFAVAFAVSGFALLGRLGVGADGQSLVRRSTVRSATSAIISLADRWTWTLIRTVVGT